MSETVSSASGGVLTGLDWRGTTVESGPDQVWQQRHYASRVGRWQAFCEEVAVHAPACAIAIQLLVDKLRAELAGEWPLASATGEWTVFAVWQLGPLYVELEVEPYGSATLFCKANAETEMVDLVAGGALPEQILAWLRERAP